MTHAPARRILGIDPGLTVTGFAVLDALGADVRLVEAGALRLRSTTPRPERLAHIFERVRALIEAHHPHEIAVEQQFVAENARSALAIGEARAAAIVAASTLGLPVFEFAPTEVKEAVCGWGGAGKEQVHQMVLVHLGLTELAGPADVSDAAAIAITRATAARFEAALAR